MDSGDKLTRARNLLAPLLAGHHPDDEIFFVPFTDRVEAFQQLTPEQRLHPPAIHVGSEGRGTALYDALASTLCRMRTAQNPLRAIVIITDGADQHSRLTLDQLVALTQASSVQVFTIGLFDRFERDVFGERQKTVTLVGEREIDNPIVVFERLAKETGAESFFPQSDDDLKKALERISAILQAQYTLAYYPHETGRFRRIEVKVRRRGVRVLSRRGAGAEGDAGIVQFGPSCEVSPTEHLYPWEPRVLQTLSGGRIYEEDFSSPATGWPNRREQKPASAAAIAPDLRSLRMQTTLATRPVEYRPGLRYLPGGYEISRTLTADMHGPTARGTVVAYGPSWDDFQASVTVETDWSRTNTEWFGTQTGMIFGLGESGYGALVVSGTGAKNGGELAYELIRNDFATGKVTTLIPWTKLPPRVTPVLRVKLTVERRQREITVLVDDRQGPTSRAKDESPGHGLIGLGLFGDGRAVFRDLRVESLP